MNYLFTFSVIALSGLAHFDSHAQGMAINTTGAAANSSAMLDVTSNSKGVLIPRMDSAQRSLISAPATGLLVYQNNGVTPGFYYYNGSAWTAAGGSGGGISGAASGALTGSYPNPVIGSDKVNISSISATGSPSATTYLEGDGKWASTSAGSGGSSSPYRFCTNFTSPVGAVLTYYYGLSYYGLTTGATYAEAYGTVMNKSCTFSTMGLELTTKTTTGTTVDNVTATLCVNGTPTSLSLSLNSSLTVGVAVQATYSGSASVTASAGDLVNWMVTQSSAPYQVLINISTQCQ